MLRIFGLITLISLSFIQFAFVQNAFGEPVGSPELKWIEDGEILPLDWRSSSSWVWKGQSLALQMYLEVPENIAEKLPKTIERINPSNSAPLKAQPGYVVTLLQLTSPSQIITITKEPSVRAIRVDVPYDKTTWMRHASCQPYKVFLEEKTRTTKGPFFVSLFCDEVGDAVSIHVEQSNEAELELTPLAEGKVAGKIVKFSKAARSRSYRSLALLRSNINGEQVSAYELAADFQPAPAPVEVPAPLPVIENRISFGIGAQRAFADHARFGQGRTETLPILFFDSKFGRGNWNIAIDVPIEQMSSATTGTSLASLRILKEAGANATWAVSYGLQAYRLMSTFMNPGGETASQSESGYSPAIALCYLGSAKSLQTQLTVAPLDLRSKMPFANLDLTRLLYEAEKSRLKLVASGFTGGHRLGGNSEWSVNGFAIGFRGEY